MSQQERSRWDAIYRQRNHLPYPQPEPLLYTYTPPVAPAAELRALDLAGGVGQNGMWLAEQGYIVDVFDISRMALMRGRAEMSTRELRNLNFIQIDLDTPDIATERYAVVCVFSFFKRHLFPAIRASIHPGGRIIYRSYNTRYLRQEPGHDPSGLLEPGELGGYFADWKIIHHADDRHVSEIVAIKPG